MPKRIIILVLGATLFCSAAAAEPFEVLAYEAPGMLPFPGEIIVRDARVRVPDAAKTCGVTAIKIVNATDGVVLFRFDASAEQRKCMERALPKGTQLRSLGEGRTPTGKAGCH